MPGLVPNPVLLRIDSGRRQRGAEPWRSGPALRRLFVTGLASGRRGQRAGQRRTAPASRTAAARGAGGWAASPAGRWASSGLTVAYESANRLTPSSASGPFVDDRARGAVRRRSATARCGRDDLRSRDHLFVRLDTPRATPGLGRVPGPHRPGRRPGRLHPAAQRRARRPALRRPRTGPGRCSRAKNDVAYARRVVPRERPGERCRRLLDPDIVVGSESVSLASLDRRTGAVVLQTLLVRDADYALDYASGALRFLSLPLPLDARFNPQVVVVQYQYAGPRVRSQTSGGRLELPLGAAARGWASATSTTRPAAATTRSSSKTSRAAATACAGRWRTPPAAATSAPIAPPRAAARAVEALRGNADRDARPLRTSAPSTTSTTAGFANPFGGLATPGLQNYRVALARIVPEHSEITLALDGQRNRGPLAGDAQRSASLHLRRTVSQPLLARRGRRRPLARRGRARRRRGVVGAGAALGRLQAGTRRGGLAERAPRPSAAAKTPRSQRRRRCR